MNNYDDIINLPHHVSKNRPHMSNYDRAAQFSPFAALKGYDDEIEEVARLTDEKYLLEGTRVEEINEKLLLLKETVGERPLVKIVYFVPDGKKAGGAYLTVEARLKKLSEIERKLILDNNLTVSFDDVYDISLPNGSL
ncbi:MAG: hypothetical protein J1G02_02740 [Clostridiales bacterium]|nr:hypothetical protein [Clostridiales bacterium]